MDKVEITILLLYNFQLESKQDTYTEKVETGEIIKTDMIEQEIEQEKQLNKKDDTNGIN